MSTEDVITYLLSSLRWLGIIWGALLVSTFITAYVLAALTGAGESGSAEEEGDQ